MASASAHIDIDHDDDDDIMRAATCVSLMRAIVSVCVVCVQVIVVRACVSVIDFNVDTRFLCLYGFNKARVAEINKTKSGTRPFSALLALHCVVALSLAT